MSLDASIASSGRAYSTPDPIAMQGNIAQMQANQMAVAAAKRAQEQERVLSDLYRTNMGADGKVNQQGILAGIAQQGMGSQIPGLQKSFAEADKATADVGHVGAQTDKLKFETLKGKLDVTGAAISSLLTRPNVTHDDVIQALTGLVQGGVLSQEQGAQMSRQLPGDPTQLRQYLVSKGMETVEAGKRMELMAPQYDKVNSGKVTSFVDTNPYTNPNGPAAIRMTTTPGEDQSAATTRRGQNMTDARSRDSNNIAQQSARTQIVEGPDGFVLVDKGTGMARPALMAGAPVLGKDPGLNDVRAKALLFGTRMQNAEKVMTDMASKGTVRPSVIKGAVERVPFIGGALGAGANAMSSDQQQKVEQAQRDFVNAVLRRESGAAISPTEFESATKQYFPSVGDSQAVITQKAQNRQLATRGLLAEVPAKRRGSIDTDAGASNTPADIAAILKKHGSK